VPGLNEEIAATSVWGTQQVSLQSDRKVQGVFGIWYGKGPGVDRSGDAIKHANMAGTSALGGVLCIAGDDHACKSSTLPHHSDLNLRDMNVPIFTPGSVSELIEYGITALELSRFSGCWTAMKVTSQTIDSAASTVVPSALLPVQLPDPRSMHALPPSGLNIQQPDDWNTQEMRMYAHKLPAVGAFLRANKLDRVIFGATSPATLKCAIVSAGISAWEVVEVLEELGISDERARQLGLAVVKIAVVWPLESEGICALAAACQEVLVVEEKRALIEPQLKEALYNSEGRRPRVTGKRSLDGARLLQEEGELSHADIRRAILATFARVFPSEFAADATRPVAVAISPTAVAVTACNGQAATALAPPIASSAAAVKRMPYFCAGCPHNSSTVVPEGSQAMGGIGCHTLALFMPGRFSLFTHMGCEVSTRQ
jgi:indolepyruvate ferredoxin oxidoreductase